MFKYITKINENCILQAIIIVNIMKKVLYLLGITASILLTSCKNDDDAAVITPPRDYAEVYSEDIIKIEEYLRSHTLTVTRNGDDVASVIFDSLTSNGISIMDQTEYPLQYKIVRKHGIDYKLYYLKLDTKGDTEIDGKKPSGADQVLATYEGRTLKNEVFDSNTRGASFDLTSVISGWQLIIPEFRSGDNAINPDGTLNFSNYGSGVMFVPSGLAYFNSSSTGISSYSCLIFTFNLHQVFYLDHDNDGIPSRYEFGYDTDGNLIDTDADGIADYIDYDDDNDGYLTKEEIKINGVVPDFADILSCNGTTTGTKKHLDATCH